MRALIYKSIWVLGFLAVTWANLSVAELQSTVSLTASQTFAGQNTSFNISSVSGSVSVAAGTLYNTYSGVTRFLVSSSSGRYSGLNGSSFYGIDFGPFHIFQSLLSANYMTVVSSGDMCPPATTYNWLMARMRTPDASRGPMNATQPYYTAGGTIAYDPAGAHPVVGNTIFDLSGPTLNSSPNYTYDQAGSNPCTSSVFRVGAASGSTQPLDQFGTFYFGDSSFAYLSYAGNPVVALGAPQETLSSGTMTGLNTSVFTGQYTYFNTVSSQTRTNIYMFPDSAGTTYSLYTIDDVNTPSSKTSYGTLSCTSLNSPSNGFCSGTLALIGVSGTGKATCMVSTTTPELLLTCAAQYPGDNSKSVSIVGRVARKAVLSVTVSPSVAQVATAGSSTTITATVRNMTGKNIPTIGNPSDVGLRLSAPFSNTGAYSGGGGSCGSSLSGYASCTVTITFNPSAVGSYLQVFRVAYDDGYFGTVNATANVIGTAGLSSMAVTPATASFPAGTTVQYTATATYTDASTQDVTSIVTWSTTNGNSITGATGNVLFTNNGATGVTATLGTTSGTRSVTSSGTSLQVLGQSTATGLDGASVGEANPRFTFVTADQLFVSDSGNHRVLIWNSIPSANQEAPDLVLGQADFNDKTANTGGISAQTMNNPMGIATDGTHFVVADYGNNRVLIWNAIPTTNQQAADLVLGQSNFTSSTANNGGRSSSSLSAPMGVAITGTKLFVTDYSNNRVLIWNTFPTANKQAADLVLGQSNFTAGTANNGGISSQTLSGPYSVYSDGTRLWVTDFTNNRVLQWSSIPTTNRQAANYVLGQTNFTSATANNGGQSAATLNGPSGVYSDGTKLFVSDYNNNRILQWTSIPSASGASATYEIGQPNMTSRTANNGGVAAKSLNLPYGIHSDGTALYAADYNNSRILIYSTFPTANQPNADLELGQPNMTSNTANNAGAPTSQSMNLPQGVANDGTRLFVADYSNNRVLIWNSIPTTDDQAADLVLGQSNFTSNTANNGGRSSSSLNAPSAVYSDGTRLFVADYSNNRVLIWNTIPTTNKQAANVELGQPGFTQGTANNGGVSSTTLSAPVGVYSTGSKLFVSDLNNNRVLIWNSIPTSNRQAADLVLGQTNFTSSTANNGGVSASTLSAPRGLYVSGTKLFVADSANNRVLMWNTIPTSSGTAADLVQGQSNFTAVTANNGGRTASSLSRPMGVTSDGTKFYIADFNNNRVLVWNSIPTSTRTAADQVIGQPSFTVATANNGGISASRLYNPLGLVSDGSKLWIADYNNKRVLVSSVSALLVPSVSTWDYGTIGLSQTSDKSITITNSGTSTATAMAAGTPAMSAPFGFKGGSYPGTGGTCGATLAGQATCTIVVTYSPTNDPAPVTDIARISYNDGSSTKIVAISLSAQSINRATLTFSVASYNFGTIPRNTTTYATLTISNSSGVTASGMTDGSPAMAAPFTFRGTANNYPGQTGTCGTLLKTGSSCTVIIAFTPTTTLTVNDTARVQYSDGVSTQTISVTLSGKGS
jgi:hypothetical protein